MIITLLLLASALSLSAIAGYFSVIGMTAIFAAAWWPVVVMTGMLEFSKVVVASWLYRNWDVTPRLLKAYLTTSVIVLMVITSLGIFGFLSKAHIEQTMGMGDNTLFVQQIEQQIAVERTRIEDNRKVIQQMDEAVSAILSQSTTASAQRANRGGTIAQQASQLRQKQKPDRDLLTKAIDDANLKIRDLNSQKLKIEQSQLKLEAEVGPIKYIAEMIYGSNPDKNLMEKAVRYVIILIIFVFDPLAVLMIIAANMSMLQWSTSRAKNKSTPTQTVATTTEQVINKTPASENDIRNNDEKNGLAWVQATTSSGSYQIPVRYPNEHASAKLAENVEIHQIDQPETKPGEAAVTAENVEIHQIDQLEATKPVEAVSDKQEAQSDEIQAVMTFESNVTVTSEETTSQIVDDGVTTKKPDDILQKIKQYHNVRLDDARRTIR